MLITRNVHYMQFVIIVLYYEENTCISQSHGWRSQWTMRKVQMPRFCRLQSHLCHLSPNFSSGSQSHSHHHPHFQYLLEVLAHLIIFLESKVTQIHSKMLFIIPVLVCTGCTMLMMWSYLLIRPL